MTPSFSTARKISYFDDYETFEREWSARNISYIDDFETDKNLSHKEKFLFYGPYCMIWILGICLNGIDYTSFNQIISFNKISSVFSLKIISVKRKLI